MKKIETRQEDYLNIVEQAKIILLRELKEYEFSGVIDGLFICEVKNIIDPTDNLSQQDFISKCLGIINNNQNPWLFKVVFDTAFTHTNTTVNITMKVDGDVVVDGHHKWTKFLLECTSKLGVDVVQQIPEIGEAIHDTEEQCRNQSRTCSIREIDGKYVNQQRLCGGSQNSGTTFEKKVNEYFGYSKVVITFEYVVNPSSFVRSYKIKNK